MTWRRNSTAASFLTAQAPTATRRPTVQTVLQTVRRPIPRRIQKSKRTNRHYLRPQRPPPLKSPTVSRTSPSPTKLLFSIHLLHDLATFNTARSTHTRRLDSHLTTS